MLNSAGIVVAPLLLIKQCRDSAPLATADTILSCEPGIQASITVETLLVTAGAPLVNCKPEYVHHCGQGAGTVRRPLQVLIYGCKVGEGRVLFHYL